MSHHSTLSGKQQQLALKAIEAGGLHLEYAAERLILMPQRYLYCYSQDAVVLADVHLGKESVFQRHGMALPDGIAEADLQRIGETLETFKPAKLIILGDLVHALPAGDEPWIATFSSLLKQFAETQFHVVGGNHDKPGTAERMPTELHWHHRLRLGNCEFRHVPLPVKEASRGKYDRLGEPAFFSEQRVKHHQRQPKAAANVPDTGKAVRTSNNHDASDSNASTSLLTFAGHLHPCHTLVAGSKHNPMRMPVYWCTEQQIILPAFGEFTGMHSVRPAATDRLFGIGPDSVLEIPCISSPSRPRARRRS